MQMHGRRFPIPLILAMVLTSGLLLPTWSGSVSTQSLPRLFDGSFAPRAEGPHAPRLALRNRRAIARLQALNAPALSLNLFDNVEIATTRTKVERPRADRVIWHGRGEDGSQVVLSVVKGVLSGTVYSNGQTYDMVFDGNGLYRISELDASAFPTDDPLDMPSADLVSGSGANSTTPPAAGDVATQIDVLVLWTPAARNGVGGTQAAIESLIQSAVANANLAYTNSHVNAQLRLVHDQEVTFTETSSINNDLTSLQTSGDGKLEVAQSLREQYGADVVTLIGSGYSASGACGSGYLMSAPSTSFAAWAYNVVDQSCAAGYLSYAHEVGHNEGLHHDPANATGTPSYPYAYGYQDPGGIFRTVMSYGTATRVPFFSSPSLLYNGLPMGTSSQSNASALAQTASIVAQFRAATDGSSPAPPPPPCTYSVTPTSVSFSAAGGSSTLTVTTTSGCSWSSSSGTSWVTATGTGTLSGAAKVTAAQNTSSGRSCSVTVAGIKVSVSQQGAKVRGKKR
jgi:peptidyl-Asp metalloendopeptidase